MSDDKHPKGGRPVEAPPADRGPAGDSSPPPLPPWKKTPLSPCNDKPTRPPSKAPRRARDVSALVSGPLGSIPDEPPSSEQIGHGLFTPGDEPPRRPASDDAEELSGSFLVEDAVPAATTQNTSALKRTQPSGGVSPPARGRSGGPPPPARSAPPARPETPRPPVAATRSHPPPLPRAHPGERSDASGQLPAGPPPPHRATPLGPAPIAAATAPWPPAARLKPRAPNEESNATEPHASGALPPGEVRADDPAVRDPTGPSPKAPRVEPSRDAPIESASEVATPARAPSADELPTIALPAYAPSVASAAVAASFDATAPSPLEDDAAQASSDGPPPLAPEASGASVPPSDPRRAVRGLGLGLPSFAEVLAQGRAVAGRLESRARQLVRDATAAAGSRAPAAEVGEPAGGARLSQGVRPRWFLPAIAAAGLAVGIGLVALVAALTRKNEVPPAASAPSPSVIAPPEASTALAAPPAEPPIAPPPPRPCVVAGAPQVVAPSALVTAGVEVRSLGEDSVAIGFAVDDHQATALRLDPTSLGAMSATRRSKLAIHRVTPTSGARGGLQATLDVDRPNDSIQGRRAVGWSSLQLGEAAGGLVWARAGGAPAGRLWDLPGDGELDALRASVATGQEQEPMVAVAFRRGGAVHVGVASGQSVLSPRGELESFAGLGGGVGSPAVAMSDGVVLAAWADRASADAPWRLRWVRFRAGERAPDPSTFSPPGGGKGDAAMSPAIAAVPGKRFLLVWTEGPAAQHELRALTLAEDGSPVGAALSLSKDDVNAGQGQAALTASGRGVVAFLESTADGFEVAATPIQCPL